MNPILATLLQGFFIILIAPFASGLVRFCKARLQGRKGASPFLPYYTFATLFKKQMVISAATSWVFRVVPFVVFSTSIALAFILPLLFVGGKLASMSDFLVVAGILMIGSIFLVLGGLDPGSAFGGMGSSREMTIAALVEPTIIMVFAAMSFVGGTFAIDGMIGQQLVFSHPYLLLSIFAFLLVTLAENARYPVDNPATHLELTMVHEAMILEYSGAYLAMLEYASAIKLTVFAILLSNFIFPATVGVAASLGIGSALVAGIVAIFIGIIKVVIAMGLLALLESVVVKMRFYRMQEYMSIAFFTAMFGMLIAMFSYVIEVAIEYHTLFAALAVFFVILLFGRARSQVMLRYYAFSSLSIAGIAFGLSFILGEEEKKHLWLFAAVTILIKSIIIPIVVRYAQRKHKEFISSPSFLRPASSYFVAVVILGATFFVMKQTPIIGVVEFDTLLFASIALVGLGLATMIVHRNIFSQILGLLIIENGVTVFTLVTVKSLPLLIELGVFIIIVASAFILSILGSRIREFHGSSDTEDLRNLIE
ncbi:MAG: Hydrogenase, membrane subunit 3-like protein (EchB-like) [Parcubacteria group bacterium GW2011_GWD2_38_11]|nr:MAG: Hydrogenase, membrane subunit 3-like protein (EchB-like) [Parcubacteria group bacterium GW2011_GWD2_38_11]